MDAFEMHEAFEAFQEWFLPISAFAFVIYPFVLLLWTIHSANKAHEFQNPKYQNVELDACKRPTCKAAPCITDGQGLECLVLSNAAPCRPNGVPFYSNALEPNAFESDLCEGEFLFIHRPTANPDINAEGGYPYSDHMQGRARLWEMRWNMRFKRRVSQQDVRIGLEQDKYYWPGHVQHRIAMSFEKLLKHAVGDVYFTFGQDPSSVIGEAERPVVAFPLWAMDQLVITPRDEKPPDLRDALFSSRGLVKTQNRDEFRSAIDSLALEPGKTFTFALWSISRFADAINWRLSGAPMLPELAPPPVYMSMYELKRSDVETRHLDSRKAYVFSASLWSSKRPPQHDRAQQILHAQNSHLKQDVQRHTIKENRWAILKQLCLSR